MGRIVFPLLFCCALACQSFAQTRIVDSLRRVLASKKLSDTAQVMTSLALAFEIRYSDTKQCVALSSKALERSKKINFEKGVAEATYILGITISLQRKYVEALDYYLRSLKVYEKLKDERGIGRILNNIAIVYYYQQNYGKAEIFLKRSLAINEKIRHIPEIARSLNNLGRNCLEQQRPKEALGYFHKALEIHDKYKISTDNAVYYCNVAEALLALKDYKVALKYGDTAIAVAQRVKNKRIEARGYVVQGGIYLNMDDVENAKRVLELGTPIANKPNLPEERLLALQYSARLYERTKDYPKAFAFLKEYKAFSDTILNQNNYRIALQREQDYQDEKRDMERYNESLVRYSLIAGVLLAFGLVFFAYRAFRVKSKAFAIISQQQEELQMKNEELTQNQEEIIAQRNFIEEQNEHLVEQNYQITQSIKTALVIQKALLPFDSRVRGFIKEYFVIYRPRDIVSGDFYWIERVENHAIIVAADCTGHGVPGAFMSLIAINLLERVVLQQNILQPANILYALHDLVRLALKQDEVENQSGMDLGVVVMDLEDRENISLHFAGAKRPLYYINAQKQGEISKCAGSRRGIGGFQNEQSEFHEEHIILPAESIIYLSSDGLADQNNVRRKRLGETPILEALQANYPQMGEQKKALEAKLDAYMEDTSQRDDILFLAVRV